MNSHNCYILVSVYLQTQRTMYSRKHLVKNSQIQMCTVFLFWSLLCAILLQSNFYSYNSLSACRNIYFVFCKLVLHGISQPRIKLLLLFFVRLNFFALSELNIETGTRAQKWPCKNDRVYPANGLTHVRHRHKVHVQFCICKPTYKHTHMQSAGSGGQR